MQNFKSSTATVMELWLFMKKKKKKMKKMTLYIGGLKDFEEDEESVKIIFTCISYVL